MPLVLIAAAALLAGLAGGLARLGWGPPGPLRLVRLHGPLMVSGFLGTVVALERAAALRNRWAFAAPALTAAGVLIAFLTGSESGTAACVTLGSLALAILQLRDAARAGTLPAATLAAGALLWFEGNLLWLTGRPIFQAAPTWVGFLVLTIVGERCELARLRLPGPRTRAAAAALVTASAGLLAATPLDPRTLRGAGVALLGLCGWLLWYELAWRSMRRPGLSRYLGACLLAGYVWLAVGAAAWIALPLLPAGPAYDAPLHAVLLGFVFSMIFGHAPVVLPALLGRRIAFSRAAYGPLILLHLSVALRMGGDFSTRTALQQWGGLFNAVAVLAFLAITAAAVRAVPRA